MVGGAEVGLDHAGLGSDQIGWSPGDDFAEVEYDHAIAEPQYQVHVVIDQQHRHPPFAAARSRSEPAALCRVEARGRFVEQRHRRASGEHPRHRHELALTLGEGRPRRHR